MGDIRIRLRANVQTGQREIVIDYEADPSRTRVEHERRHRELVELLVARGSITRDEAAQVVFEEHGGPQSAGEAAAEGQAG